LKKLLPWLILAAIFALLLHQVPLDKVIVELKVLNPFQIAGLGGIAIIFIVGVSAIDGLAMWYGFSVFKVGLRWKEIVLVRAAMMLLAVLATPIGQAGLAAHLVRKHKLPAGESAGMVMFLFLVEIYGMVALATVFFPVLLAVKGGGLDPGAPVMIAGVMVAAAWPALAVVFILCRWEGGEKILARVRLDSLLYPFRTFSAGQFARLLLLKTALAAWQIALTWPCFLLYGIDMPVLGLVALMPLAILISAIPVTPGRLGTTQASWVIFFAYLAAPESLLVFSLLLQVLLNLARWIVGGAAMPLVYRDLAGDRRSGILR